ncbi:unnamed protein product [Cylicocyclus nassatus]|uniref:Uncharacterized protein n=1 Tax=Cylicocyclus nassatus TaxID=53992 RepID=A0AA36HCR0_CYLNA|nr:unnamed protein product [Cylicocyclus nassatus]
MSTLILTLSVAILITSIMTDDDCYKYSKSEFTTIVECKHGCEYSFISKGKVFKRISGGCSAVKETGCRKGENEATVCTCKGDLCNLSGYIMENSESNES